MVRNFAKKAVLIVSFGTRHPETREKTIGAIEKTVANAFSSHLWMRCFTSKSVIRNIEKEEEIHIPSIEEAIERLLQEGIKEILIQPTHFINGREVQKVKEIVKSYVPQFETIRFGSPLITSEEDLEQVLRIIIKDTECYDDPDTAICLMGHGTTAQANEIYEKMQETLRRMGHANYYIGTVEASPSFEDMKNALEKKQYQKIVLQPMMIVAGEHALSDMAGDQEDSWKCKLKKEGYEVCAVLKGLGELEEIQTLLAAHAKEAEEIYLEG